MASLRAILRSFKSKHHYSLDTSSNKAAAGSVKAQKTTKAGRHCSLQPQAEQISQLPRKAADTIATETVSDRQVGVVSMDAYQSAVNKMVGLYHALPDWKLRGGQTRMVQMKKNEDVMCRLAYDLLSPEGRKDIRNVKTVFDAMNKAVHARTVKCEPEWRAAQQEYTAQHEACVPKSILKGAGGSSVKKTVVFAL